MNQKIEPAKVFTEALEGCINFFLLRHVARIERRVRHLSLRQALDIVFEPFALISKCQLRAGRVQRLRRRPRDRALVGDAKNDSPFVFQHD